MRRTVFLFPAFFILSALSLSGYEKQHAPEKYKPQSICVNKTSLPLKVGAPIAVKVEEATLPDPSGRAILYKSGTQTGINQVIGQVRQKYGVSGCRFDLATSLAGDGKEVDKSMMCWENYTNGWAKFIITPTKKAGRKCLRERGSTCRKYTSKKKSIHE
jgi:hypothetical protein